MAMIEKLGSFIERLDRPNTSLYYGIDDICGITNTKQLVLGTKANLIGRTFEKFSILAPREFIFNRRTSRNGERISLGYNTTDREWILTEDYCHFRVRKDKEEILDPDYLYLFFLDSEFDRYARFNSWGSATEFFNWEEIIETPIPILPIEEQRKIVRDYRVITDRIELLKRMNENLVEQGLLVLQDKMSISNRRLPFDEIATLFDYLRKPVSGSDRANLEKKYPYYGAAALMDYIDEYIFDGIFGLIAEDGSVMDDDGHPTLQYVWGKFWVNNHAHIFQGKNGFSTEMVYLLLKKVVIRDIVTGAVQLKVNQENLRSFMLDVPDKDTMDVLERIIHPLFSYIRTNTDEINKLSALADLCLKSLNKGSAM